MPAVMCDGRNLDKRRVDENNHVIWRDIGLAVMSNPLNNLDVSTRCTTLLADNTNIIHGADFKTTINTQHNQISYLKLILKMFPVLGWENKLSSAAGERLWWSELAFSGVGWRCECKCTTVVLRLFLSLSFQVIDWSIDCSSSGYSADACCRQGAPLDQSGVSRHWTPDRAAILASL